MRLCVMMYILHTCISVHLLPVCAVSCTLAARLPAVCRGSLSPCLILPSDELTGVFCSCMGDTRLLAAALLAGFRPGVGVSSSWSNSGDAAAGGGLASLLRGVVWNENFNAAAKTERLQSNISSCTNTARRSKLWKWLCKHGLQSQENKDCWFSTDDIRGIRITKGMLTTFQICKVKFFYTIFS